MNDTDRPNVAISEHQPKAARSDSYVGRLLLLFFLALYLLTGSGHAYSPDGEFAYRMAHSISADPNHSYLHEMQKGFSQWGVMVPLLSQPLILLGEVAANLAPQKDHATVDGRSYKLGIFREPGLPEEAPTVGPSWDIGESSYVRTDIDPQPATSLVMISFLSLATTLPQDFVVGTVSVVDVTGETLTLPIRAGVETAEWRSGGGASGLLHGLPRIASTWAGNTTGRNYYAELPLGKVMHPREIRFEYQADQGRFFVRSLALADAQSGALQVVPSNYGFWSDRENREYFSLLIYTSYNAIVSAISCLLLFALIRLFGYSQVVAACATLIYGLATLAWPYSKFDFSEPTLVMFVLATLYLVYRWGHERRNRLLFLAGLAALAAVATKYVAAILVPAIGLQILLLHWERHPSLRGLKELIRPAFAFSAPFLAVAAPALWYLGQRFGYTPSILEAWAGVQRGWLPLPITIGLKGLLFSPGRSFFIYSPPMLLALFSAIPFVKRHGTRSIGLLTIAAIYFSVYSKKVAWDAGSGWGPRYQLVIIPLLILVIAPLIQKAIEERHQWARYALIATFTLGVCFQLLGVSKSFESYLGMFRSQIVDQLPEKGAPYGGADYYPHAEGLYDGNSISATVWALPFSPIPAHAWLLSADAVALGSPYLDPLKTRILESPPWRLLGIDVMPANPENGLGLDFWSMKLRTDFPSSPGLLAVGFLVVLLLQGVLVATGARMAEALAGNPLQRGGAIRAWLVVSVSALGVFDAVHLFL